MIQRRRALLFRRKSCSSPSPSKQSAFSGLERALPRDAARQHVYPERTVLRRILRHVRDQGGNESEQGCVAYQSARQPHPAAASAALRANEFVYAAREGRAVRTSRQMEDGGKVNFASVSLIRTAVREEVRVRVSEPANRRTRQPRYRARDKGRGGSLELESRRRSKLLSGMTDNHRR